MGESDMFYDCYLSYLRVYGKWAFQRWIDWISFKKFQINPYLKQYLNIFSIWLKKGKKFFRSITF